MNSLALPQKQLLALVEPITVSLFCPSSSILELILLKYKPGSPLMPVRSGISACVGVGNVAGVSPCGVGRLAGPTKLRIPVSRRELAQIFSRTTSASILQHLCISSKLPNLREIPAKERSSTSDCHTMSWTLVPATGHHDVILRETIGHPWRGDRLG
jgi:hypothetical protein